MDSLYRIIFYSIIYILSPFYTNHIPSYLGSRINIVSKGTPNAETTIVSIDINSTAT